MIALGFLIAFIIAVVMAALLLEKDEIVSSLLMFATAGYLFAEFAFQIRS